MPTRRIGAWLVGARGGVATTMMAGLAALQRQAIEPVGLLTATAPFQGLDLVDYPEIVVGGHDIRSEPLAAEARRMWTQSRAITPELLDHAAEFFAATEPRIRPGIVVGSGERIQSLADPQAIAAVGSPRAAVDRIRSDLEAFAATERLDHVVMVNLASTEPPPDRPIPLDVAELEPLLADAERCPLPASSLYFLAAVEAGCSYVNFTPSAGGTPACLQQLALERGVPQAGSDGKTGETLLKSVLAPLFAGRNLEVMSWVGHNIFGNLDGKVLDDPRNKAAKVKSKDHLLASILGYPPQTHVSIEYIASLGDWKTAWDHVHFRGFLGTPMTLQFTWQGCDSILAAPLVLDLIRLVERAHRAGERAAVTWLACFFKSPLGVTEQSFTAQLELLRQWVARHVQASGTKPDLAD